MTGKELYIKITELSEKVNSYFRKKVIWIVLLGIITFVYCNGLYDFYGVKLVWYYGSATAFLCYGYALYLLKKHFITELLCILVLGQFIDEITGNALIFDYTEWVFLFAFLLYKILYKPIYKLFKKKK